MPDGEDFLWRPILRGVMQERDLYDRAINLSRFVDANEALDIFDENESRVADWRRKNSGS